MYTPPWLIAKVREAMGSIDTDPCSCEKAQEIVKAKRFYTKGDNGLVQNWYGNVFANPPYSRGMMDLFSGKLYEELQSENATQAILLCNAQTASKWYQKACYMSDAKCDVSPRISFIDGETMKPKNGNDRSQTIFYFGGLTRCFYEFFKDVGYI